MNRKNIRINIGEKCSACQAGIIEEREPYGKWTHVIGCTICPTEVRSKGATIIGVK